MLLPVWRGVQVPAATLDISGQHRVSHEYEGDVGDGSRAPSVPQLLLVPTVRGLSVSSRSTVWMD